MVLCAAGLYFVWVFGAGFLLGMVRVPLLVPRVGARVAELLELPVMLLIVVWVARRRVTRTAALSAGQQLAVGALAWGMLIAAEIALGVALTDNGPLEVLRAHDPVSGTGYYASTVVFALAPWFWRRRQAITVPTIANADTPPTTQIKGSPRESSGGGRVRNR